MSVSSPASPSEPVLLPTPRHLSWGDTTLVLDKLRVPRVVMGTGVDGRAESYRLTIAADASVTIDAADPPGAFYAAATLEQMRSTAIDGRLRTVEVSDWPDHPVRGVMLDISRDKVPTMDTLRDLVVRLASWKINQLQLYTEHTFAYVGHDEVWRDASPLTVDELHQLDAWCARHHVELVPNQNGLGHMERWLRHPRYHPLALAPDGFEFFGRHRGPSTLEPTDPASLALVRDLYAQLLPNLTSRRVHIGLDEPWELPGDRYADYVGWIERLAATPELADRELLMWGDIVAHHPDTAADLPASVTICEWGYDAGHPFAARAEALAAAGRPFWLCPGTSSWLSILGRVTNMRTNIVEACDAARVHGAAGVLLTDWGDNGHLQYLPVSEPGFAWFAAQAWCAEANSDLDLAAALDTHVWGDRSGRMGATVLALGDIYLASAAQFPNMSLTTLHLYYPEARLGGGPWPTDEEDAQVEQMLDTASDRLRGARPTRADGALLLDELANAIALVRVLCADAGARLAGDGTMASVPGSDRVALAASLEPVMVEHRRLWAARNRPGGLADSVAWLERLHETYRTGTAPAFVQ